MIESFERGRVAPQQLSRSAVDEFRVPSFDVPGIAAGAFDPQKVSLISVATTAVVRIHIGIAGVGIALHMVVDASWIPHGKPVQHVILRGAARKLRSFRVSEYKAHEQDGKASIYSHSDPPCTTLGVRAEPNSLIGTLGA